MAGHNKCGVMWVQRMLGVAASRVRTTQWVSALAALALLPLVQHAQAQDESAATQQTPAQVATVPVPAANWSLALPPTDSVRFKGMAERDKAGIGGAAMAYPINTGAIFLAAVLVHGALNEATKSAQKSDLQKAADRVLQPYEPVLSKYTHHDLVAALAEQPVPAGSQQARWHVQSDPVFSLTPDETAFVLENDITVREAGPQGVIRYQGVVKVVAAATPQADPRHHWMANDGAPLKAETGALFLESIALAVDSAAQRWPTVAAKPQTYRYLEGTASRAERASLVAARCPQIVLRTLRNTLLSVPADSMHEPCGGTAPVTASASDGPGTP